MYSRPSGENPPRPLPRIRSTAPSSNGHGSWRGATAAMGAAIYGLARAADADRLGCNLFEVPAGRSAFPYHYHCGIEEAIYIIERLMDAAA